MSQFRKNLSRNSRKNSIKSTRIEKFFFFLSMSINNVELTREELEYKDYNLIFKLDLN